MSPVFDMACRRTHAHTHTHRLPLATGHNSAGFLLGCLYLAHVLILKSQILLILQFSTSRSKNGSNICFLVSSDRECVCVSECACLNFLQDANKHLRFSSLFWFQHQLYNVTGTADQPLMLSIFSTAHCFRHVSNMKYCLQRKFRQWQQWPVKRPKPNENSKTKQNRKSVFEIFSFVLLLGCGRTNVGIF